MHHYFRKFPRLYLDGYLVGCLFSFNDKKQAIWKDNHSLSLSVCRKKKKRKRIMKIVDSSEESSGGSDSSSESDASSGSTRLVQTGDGIIRKQKKRGRKPKHKKSRVNIL